MAYEFVDYTKPQGDSQFAILEDLFLQGSYRVLQTEADKDSIDPSVCKKGMIVKCLDTSKTYILAELVVGEDEFGDPVVTTTWSDFLLSVPNVGGPVKALSRWQLTIKSNALAIDAEYKIKLPFAKAIILERLEVDKLCDIELKETQNAIVIGDYATFNNIISHSFTDRAKLVYSNIFTFPDGTVLNTRYTEILYNKDPVLDKYYYYKVINKDVASSVVTTKFFVVGIHN